MHPQRIKQEEKENFYAQKQHVVWLQTMTSKSYWGKKEIYELHKEMELSRKTGLTRLQQVGHVMRMMDERVPKKALKGYQEWTIPVGRPRGRWSDALDREAKRMLKCRNWRSAEDRDAWKRPRSKLG